MISFFAEFSESFILAMYAWPFIAALLTVPLLILQYRRHNKLILQQITATYLVVLYALALLSFTLYPLPDNMAEFCRTTQLMPLMNPLHAINDIQLEGIKAVLQIVMNAVFFVPLGVFACVLFRWRIWLTALVALIISFLIELTQLTAVFGLYECSYRLFDTNDLFINTGGAILGYFAASLVPKQEIEPRTNKETVRRAGLIRHSVATLIDAALVLIVWFVTILSIYYFIDRQIGEQLVNEVLFAAVALFAGVIPYTLYGWSLGGLIVRLNHDDRLRSGVHRLIFYVIRAIFFMALFGLFDGWGILVSIVLISVTWTKWKRLPYQLI